MDVEITSAEPSDALDIAKALHAGQSTMLNEDVGLTQEIVDGAKYTSPEKVDEWKEKIRNQNESMRIWVARTDDGTVGYIVGVKNNGTNELLSIYVLPEHQGFGIAQALLQKLEEWVEAGQEIFVWVLVHNKQAIAFYTKQGFTENGDTQDCAINNYYMPAIKMVKHIQPPARSV